MDPALPHPAITAQRVLEWVDRLGSEFYGGAFDHHALSREIFALSIVDAVPETRLMCMVVRVLDGAGDPVKDVPPGRFYCVGIDNSDQTRIGPEGVLHPACVRDDYIRTIDRAIADRHLAIAQPWSVSDIRVVDTSRELATAWPSPKMVEMVSAWRTSFLQSLALDATTPAVRPKRFSKGKRL